MVSCRGGAALVEGLGGGQGVLAACRLPARNPKRTHPS